ncbi:MAG: hypothetical protein KVP17_001061 [Porospora cf. gigantea B]|uniref:uncharacterized protein n=1 Tax=Porospora cf. gigantea B TaxID=2853592 RepID=UPI003571DB82|nr:MAG: hypothetical protein KVP17_001061 [Porospora cf. gigantea B]
MEPVVRGLLFSFLAGICTAIGALSVCFVKQFRSWVFSASMGISAGVMIFASFVDILQESFQQSLDGFDLHHPNSRRKEAHSYTIVVAWFFAGWGIAMLLDLTVDLLLNMHCCEASDLEGNVEGNVERKVSKGSLSTKTVSSDLELTSDQQKLLQQLSEDHQQLLKLSLVTSLALVVHNFPEGVLTYTSGFHDTKFGLGITLAIGIHNIPEGLAVSIPTYYATNSMTKALTLSIASGLAEPLGALVPLLCLGNKKADPFVLSGILGIVSGIMVNVAIRELYVAAVKYDETGRVAPTSLFVGMAVIASSLVGFKYLE